MTPQQRQKLKIKERIRLSNEKETMGLPPDEWVVRFREKNNEIKAKWKAKQPIKISIRVPNSGSFKKGNTPHNKKSEEHRANSLLRWKAGTRKWHLNNKSRVNEQRKNRRLSDAAFKIKCNLRKRLSYLVRKSSTHKTSQTLILLGCTIEFFLKHLQDKFKKGMTFENYGEWHIDHIIPCDSFDLTKKEQQEKCFHYTNLQPLWADENRKKSNKIAA